MANRILIFGIVFVLLFSFVAFADDVTWIENNNDNDAMGLNGLGEFVHITISPTGNNESFTLAGIGVESSTATNSETGIISYWVSGDNTTWTKIGDIDISSINTTHLYHNANGTNTYSLSSGSEYYIKGNITSCPSSCAVNIWGENPNPITSIMNIVYDGGSGEQSRDQSVNLALYQSSSANNFSVHLYDNYTNSTLSNTTLAITNECTYGDLCVQEVIYLGTQENLTYWHITSLDKTTEKNLTIVMSSPNYIDRTIEHINQSENLDTFLYKSNYLTMYFYDEINNSLIYEYNFDVMTIGNTLNDVFENTSINGSLSLSNLYKDNYEIRYNNNDIYPVRSYYLDIDDNGNSYTLSLYALNTTYTQLIKFTITDVSGDVLENVTLEAKKLFASEGAYKTVAMCKTSSTGVCSMYLEYGGVYSYTLVYKGSSQSKTPEQLIYTEKTLKWEEEEVFPEVQDYYNVQYDFYFNNDTSRFILEYSVIDGSQYMFCIDLFNTSYHADSSTPFYSNCSNPSASGTKYIYQSIINQSIKSVSYMYSGWVQNINGTFNSTGEKIILGSLTEGNFPTLSDEIGDSGLFFTIILVILFGVIGAVSSPTIGIVLSLLALIGSFMIGFIDISFGWLLTTIVLGIIVIIGVNKL